MRHPRFLGHCPGRFVGYCLGGAILLAAAPGAHATTFTDDTFFTAQDRSIWTSGAGFTFDTGPRFLGTQWDVGKTIGGIKSVCVLFACADFGAEVGATTSGKVGIDYSLKVNSGTFDIQLPGRATFTTPDTYATTVTAAGTIIGDITIGSAFATLGGGLPVPTAANGPAVVRLPTLQVTGPTAQASLGLEAKIDAFAGAKVCVVACYGPAIGPLGFDKSQSIATVNLNNNHQVTVLGNTVSADQSVSALNGLLNASFNIPNLDSSSATTPGSFDGTTLTSTKRDRIAAVNANIAQIAADAVGFPLPLAGNLGPIGYNLLQANAGAALDVEQSVSFKPKVTGSYLFSSSVVPVVNGVAGALTNEIDFNFGDDVTFRPGQAGKISYVPIVNLDGTVRNQTDLVVGGNVDVKALGVNVAGLTIGPLIDAHLASTDLGHISLYDDSFDERLGSVRAAPITLDFGGCRNAVTVGSGETRETVRYVCASSSETPTGPYAGPGGTSFFDIDYTSCAAAPVGTVQPCRTIPNTDLTSLYTPAGRFGPTYIGSGSVSDIGDLYRFAANATTPSTTDAGQNAALASLGYTGSSHDFAIPQGDSIDMIVAEPPALGIVLLATLAAISLRGRRPENLMIS